MHLPVSVAIATGLAILASGASAQDSSRWTGFYAGGDIGATSGDVSSRTGAAPCHVDCGNAATSLGAHAGYGSQSSSGLVGGVEGDVGTLGR